MNEEQAKLYQEMIDLLSRINGAFYGAGTRKALEPVMDETKPLLQRARAAIVAERGEG